jgi:hypothetical protein
LSLRRCTKAFDYGDGRDKKQQRNYDTQKHVNPRAHYRIETFGDDGKCVKLGAEPWPFPKWNPTQRYATMMRTNSSNTIVLMSFVLIGF